MTKTLPIDLDDTVWLKFQEKAFEKFGIQAKDRSIPNTQDDAVKKAFDEAMRDWLEK